MTLKSTTDPATAGRDRLRGLTAFMRATGHVLKSYFTGPDGESYAPGRLFAFGLFLVAQGIIIAITRLLLTAHPPVGPADWTVFFVGVAGFEATISGTCVALILGIAPQDPGGKWWGRENSPPPSPDGGSKP